MGFLPAVKCAGRRLAAIAVATAPFTHRPDLCQHRIAADAIERATKFAHLTVCGCIGRTSEVREPILELRLYVPFFVVRQS